MRPGLSLLAVLALSACGGPGSSDETPGVLSVSSTGGTLGRGLKKAYFEPFTEETGIEVQHITAGGDDPMTALAAQRAAGRVDFDLIFVDDLTIARGPELFADHELELADDLLMPVPFPAKSVPLATESSYVVACRPDMVERCPRSYAEFFDDAAFPGDRSVPNVGPYETVGVIETALIADGVRREHLYPLDLDRAFSKLEEIKDSIRLYWTSFSGSQDVLRSGEAQIALLPDGRANQLEQSQGVELAISYHGSLPSFMHSAIPEGAPNIEAARRFMQWVIDNPEAQAVFTSVIYYGPVSRRGIKALEQAGITNHLALQLDELTTQTLDDLQKASMWLAENRDTLMDRWNEFVSR